MSETKKLYRDTNNGMIAGVCAGLAEYAELDVTIMRLIVVLATLVTGLIPGLVVYLIAAIIMPAKPEKASKK